MFCVRTTMFYSGSANLKIIYHPIPRIKILVIESQRNFAHTRAAVLSWHAQNKAVMQSIICMMTSSNGNTFRVAGHLCEEFTCPDEFHAQRPVTRSFDVFFDLRPNKGLSKQSWGWWFETSLSTLCDVWVITASSLRRRREVNLPTMSATCNQPAQVPSYEKMPCYHSVALCQSPSFRNIFPENGHTPEAFITSLTIANICDSVH